MNALSLQFEAQRSKMYQRFPIIDMASFTEDLFMIIWSII
jgi:hypothetical protein